MADASRDENRVTTLLGVDSADGETPLKAEITAATNRLRVDSQQASGDVTAVQMGDTASIDAFSRARTSEPFTLFDSKMTHDNSPLFWDDAEISGGSTTTSYNTNQSSVDIGVGASTAGVRARQTFQRFNYQPGKSQLVFVTFGEFDTATGISKRVGLFDEKNGLFFESDEGAANVVRRTYTSGSAVNNKVAQSSWNMDVMDGTGTSGVALDFTKTQIGVLDYEWLGVGRVRMGWVVDGMIYYCHQFLNTNSLTLVYMTTPNLPIRYEIENDGNGAADQFVQICASVLSEGGQEDTGIIFCKDTGTAHIDVNAADTNYPVIGIKLKSTHLDVTVNPLNLSAMAENDIDFKWSLHFNPTLSAGLTYSNITNSAVQGALGDGTITITGAGTLMSSGYINSARGGGTSVSQDIHNALRLGSLIDGTQDQIILGITPLAGNLDIHASLNWRELA